MISRLFPGHIFNRSFLPKEEGVVTGVSALSRILLVLFVPWLPALLITAYGSGVGVTLIVILSLLVFTFAVYRWPPVYVDLGPTRLFLLNQLAVLMILLWLFVSLQRQDPHIASMTNLCVMWMLVFTVMPLSVGFLRRRFYQPLQLRLGSCLGLVITLPILLLESFK